MANAHSEVSADIWRRVNTQHGLENWTLGELYGIPDSSFSLGCPPQTVTNKDTDCVVKLLDTETQDSGERTLSPAALDATAIHVRATLAVTISTKTLAQYRGRLTPDQAIHIFPENDQDGTPPSCQPSTASRRRPSTTSGPESHGFTTPSPIGTTQVRHYTPPRLCCTSMPVCVEATFIQNYWTQRNVADWPSLLNMSVV